MRCSANGAAGNQVRNRLIAIGLIVLGAVLVALFLILPTLRPVDVVTVTPLTRSQVDFNTAGSADAPVKLDEYSDFQCPYCARFSTQTEQAILDAYVDPGKVLFTYHSVGEFIGPESADRLRRPTVPATRTSSGSTTTTSSAISAARTPAGSVARRLTAFAEALDLDTTQFNSCFNNGKYRNMVLQDLSDARTLGIQSTPTFIISYQANGQTVTDVIRGAEAFSVFQQKLDAALAAAGAQ